MKTMIPLLALAAILAGCSKPSDTMTPPAPSSTDINTNNMLSTNTVNATTNMVPVPPP